MTRPTVADAAHNNAAWCDAMCRAHGGGGTFAAAAWSTTVRSPVLYPDAVTLAPAEDARELLGRVDTSAGCSIKDSFATLDLTPAGFRMLFEATWIGRSSEPEPAAGSWPRVTTADALRDWEKRWADPDPPGGVFRVALLGDPGVVVVGDDTGGAVLFGNAHIVGITNLFDRAGDVDTAWNRARNAGTVHFPGAALVGYETGSDLAAARRNGFDALGPLRVWTKD